jgi:hypothetical protein
MIYITVEEYMFRVPRPATDSLLLGNEYLHRDHRVIRSDFVFKLSIA